MGECYEKTVLHSVICFYSYDIRLPCGSRVSLIKFMIVQEIVFLNLTQQIQPVMVLVTKPSTAVHLIMMVGIAITIKQQPLQRIPKQQPLQRIPKQPQPQQIQKLLPRPLRPMMAEP